MKPPKLAPGDKLVNRREAAALCECSDSTIRRDERDGALPIVYIDEAKGRWYSRNAVLALKAKRAAPAAAGPAAEIDGGVAADAFAAYDTGATPADVVKTLRVAPDLARRLQDLWADLAGGFVVGGHARAKLLEMINGYDEANPLASGEDLVRLFDQMEVPRCASGCERWARFCTTCFRSRPRRALEAVAREAAAIEERQKRAAERDARKRAVEQARQARGGDRSASSEATPPTTSPATGSTAPDFRPPKKKSRRVAPPDLGTASEPTPRERHVPPDDDIATLIARLRNAVALVKRREPLSEEDATQLRTCVAMLERRSTDRGGGRDLTNEQATELAAVIVEFRDAAIAEGVEMPSFEEPSASTSASRRELDNAPSADGT